MSCDYSEMGRISGSKRFLHLSHKRKLVRELMSRGFGVVEIANRVGMDKGTISRWLKEPDKFLNDNLSYVQQLQSDAWGIEWKNADAYDETKYWNKHTEYIGYFNRKIKRKIYLQNHPNYNPLRSSKFTQSVFCKQLRAWESEWRSAIRFDESRHWSNHPKAAAYKKWTYFKNRRANDPAFKIGWAYRGRLNSALKSQLAGKHKHAEEIAGCSWKFLAEHLQSKFTPEMNWNNHGTYWHIDHILPVAIFDLTQPEQLERCFHWTNLQPLTATENYKKSDNIISAAA